MNDQQCDIHDVTRAAADLVALGCTLGATHFFDSVIQIQFGSVISNYVNEVISDVNDGVISAWEGVQEIAAERAELWSKELFYVRNGMGAFAGAMQVEAGIAVTASTRGGGAPYGFMLVSHGVNNIAEGVGNINNGPDLPEVVGPVRQFYQYVAGDAYRGDKIYYSVDLLLSGLGMARKVRKRGSVQLFEYDSINYERVYQQANRVALLFEALVDSITIGSIFSDENAGK